MSKNPAPHWTETLSLYLDSMIVEIELCDIDDASAEWDDEPTIPTMVAIFSR